MTLLKSNKESFFFWPIKLSRYPKNHLKKGSKQISTNIEQWKGKLIRDSPKQKQKKKNMNIILKDWKRLSMIIIPLACWGTIGLEAIFIPFNRFLSLTLFFIYFLGFWRMRKGFLLKLKSRHFSFKTNGYISLFNFSLLDRF